jgi:hypothetical protein
VEVRSGAAPAEGFWGPASPATLQRFPLDTIKMDGSFIRDITGSDHETGPADAIIAMNCRVVILNRPLPADQFTQLLLAQATEITYTGKNPVLRPM